ncbi:TPA: Gfo/Idh/MocA family oxidoreductase [Candidatus Poribacteria bacterium]|nr:Gfo/Idh/MocA family oxidoreductase [Candidatus Poribacteria bacterium]
MIRMVLRMLTYAKEFQMEKVKLGIIGAGGLSTKKIYPSLLYIPEVKLEAVCDLDENKAKRNAEKFGANLVFTRMEQMLDEAELDAVIICIGPEQHAQLAPIVLKARLPVYTEKPPAVDAAGALAVARVAKDTGQLCMTAFKKRYTPLYVRMKEQMGTDRFGKPAMLVMQRSFSRYNNSSPRSTFLLDFCIHLIDLAPWLMGKVTAVHALSPEPNTWAIQMVFESGAAGSLAFCAHTSGVYPDEQVTIYGEDDAMLFVRDGHSLTFVHDRVYHTLHQINLTTAGQEGLVESGFLSEIQAFIKAVQTADRSVVQSDIASSYRSMLAHDSIVQSARTGQWVELKYEI